MRTIFAFLLTVILAGMITSCATTNPKAKLNQVKKTFVFVTEEYPPFEYLNIDDEFDGVDVKILQAAAKMADVQVMFKMMPFDECMNMVKNGMADGIFSVTYSKEREEFLRFPKTNLSAEKNVILTSPEFKKQIYAMTDLNGVMIGVVDGYVYTPEFDNYKDCQKIKFKSQSDLVKGLVDGKVPMILSSEQPAKYYLDMYKAIYTDKKAVIEKVVVQPYHLGIEPLYIGISKTSTKSDVAFRAFSDALMMLQENGDMVTIKKKYLK